MSIIFRDKLFFIICLCLPFLFIPKMFQLNFLGGPIGSQLVVWPILFSLVSTLIYGWKKNVNFYKGKIFICFVIVYLMVMLVSLINGLIIYPYYDLIFDGPNNQIERFEKLIILLQKFNISYDRETLLGFWLVIRFLKGVVLEIFYTFGVSYMIYLWYKKRASEAMRILKKSIVIVCVIMFIYSFFEIAYFCGNDLSKEILIRVNPMLHAIKENFGWWPPLLWDSSRVRSIFPEPSQFGMYVSFILPMLWANIFNKENFYRSTLLILLTSTLLFLSLAKTSTMLLLGELVLLIIFTVFSNKRVVYKKSAYIILITGVAFLVSLQCISAYNMRNNSDIKNTVTKYQQDNIVGTFNEKSGSNSARFAIIKSDLRIVNDYPVLGVGSGLKSAYTEEYLLTEEKGVPEVNMWIKLQNDLGILKSGIPSICEFTKRLAENGYTGLFIYLLPFFIILNMYWKNRYKLLITNSENYNKIFLLIALIGSVAAGMSGVLTTVHSYWVALGVAYAYMDE